MKLVIAATPKVAIPTINELAKSHQITIVTQPDRPAGRGKQLRSSQIAQTHPDALKPKDESELQEILQGSDLLITIGYGRILSSATLQIPKYGGINLHFSLLPNWRGAAPVQRAIEAGDRISGVTVFQMDAGMDTGPIWHQIEFEIPTGASSNELFDSLSILGAEAVKTSLLEIEKGSEPVPQSGVPSIARKIDKSECVIDWAKSSDEIWRKVRAFGSNPGVYTTIRGVRIKVLEVKPVVNSEVQLPAGSLTPEGIVATGDGAIQLLKIIPSGKSAMLVNDWLNGFKPIPGETFE